MLKRMGQSYILHQLHGMNSTIDPKVVNTLPQMRKDIRNLNNAGERVFILTKKYCDLNNPIFKNRMESHFR